MFLLQSYKKTLIASALLMSTHSFHAKEVDTLAYPIGPIINKKTQESSKYNVVTANQFYQVLVAEIYNQAGDIDSTLQNYLPLALKSNDEKLVKRVTEIATGSGQLKKGLDIAKHWVDISPENIEARQYLALLLLRDNQLDRSAEQLKFVRNIIEKDQAAKKTIISNGLKFIGALLVIESHHDKAYQVFNRYIKLYGSIVYKQQQDLIIASLAMKAEKYSEVVLALKGIETSSSEYIASAILMKMKALQKLGEVDKATKLLKQLVTTGKASDSMRLELVRLMITLGEKKQASQLLNKLILKHPDNYDLLKTLIALNIDQHQWIQAKLFNNRLNRSDGYKSDASYFYGEINQAQGNLRKALVYFRKVADGSFVKKSHGKVARILAKLESVAVAQQWLHAEQKKSLKKRDESHWLKLEADLLAEENITDALAIYNKLIKLAPKKMRYRYHRGLLFERSNQIALAENDFKFVIKKQKNNADALNALGFLLTKHTTRFGEAKNYIQQAYKLKPNDPTILDSLGWVYFQTGEMSRAESILRKAYKAVKNPEIASHLILVLLKTGQSKEAQSIFDKMIKKHPRNTTLQKVKKSLK